MRVKIKLFQVEDQDCKTYLEFSKNRYNFKQNEDPLKFPKIQHYLELLLTYNRDFLEFEKLENYNTIFQISATNLLGLFGTNTNCRHFDRIQF